MPRETFGLWQAFQRLMAVLLVMAGAQVYILQLIYGHNSQLAGRASGTQRQPRAPIHLPRNLHGRRNPSPIADPPLWLRLRSQLQARLWRPRMRKQSNVRDTYIARNESMAAEQLETWRDYRLGDIFREWSDGNEASISTQIVRQPYVCKHWRQSIGCELLSQTNVSSPSKRWRALGDIVARREGDTPANGTVVVHVRLGDVLIDHDDETRQDCWREPPCTVKWTENHQHVYVYPISRYQTVVQEIRQTPGAGNTVKIVGYAYHGRNGSRALDEESVRRSVDYRQRLVQFFASHGFRASARGEHSPDEDFLYMSRAKYFVGGGGGFADLIKGIVMMRGGHVFGKSLKHITLLTG
eukprot:Tamp_14428.p1 GENE.Tamp_14428~~Tamp_14428.p1  ORF type:complete len:354 (+),score=23.61 Tamp_14428:217-1278(+)